MFTELIDSIENINDEIILLLEYEKTINDKKLKGKKLSNKERFFDLYMVKPSFMIRRINRKELKNDRVKNL